MVTEHREELDGNSAELDSIEYQNSSGKKELIRPRSSAGSLNSVDQQLKWIILVEIHTWMRPKIFTCAR